MLLRYRPGVFALLPCLAHLSVQGALKLPIIFGDHMVLQAGQPTPIPAAPQPRDVRYVWAQNPVISIENAAGLPLRPFRTQINEFATGDTP